MENRLLVDLRERVCEANIELLRQGLVKYSFGNVSGFDRNLGVVAIKPSGVPYHLLTPKMIVLVNLDRRIVGGDLRPSSDTDTHLVLYRSFLSVGGIAHTHSPYASAWAQAGREIPCLGTTHADYSRRAIPCTPVPSDTALSGTYEHEIGVQIMQTFRTIPYEETPMVLVGGHGPFTWGASPEEAVSHSVMLEEIARMAYLTVVISPEREVLKQTVVDRHFYRKHGKDAYYGQRPQLRPTSK